MESTAVKITQIMDELTLYFLNMGSEQIRVDLKRCTDCFQLTIQGSYDKQHHKQVRDLDRFLNVKSRNEGIEDVYGGLAGIGHGGDSELHLVGQMIDSFQLDVDQDTVRLRITKYFGDRHL